MLAGGGTGGHVEPALALADAVRRLDPTVTVSAIGTPRGLENRLVPARGYPLALIPPVPLPRRASRQLATVPGRLARATRAAGRVLDEADADVVVGFGGYVALPVYLAARRRGIPIVVHEANARPGLANRVGARLTRHVAAASPRCSLPHAVHIGLPLRQAIAGLDRAAARVAARAGLGLDADRPTLLVTGGSQGAGRLNDAAVGAAGTLTAAGIQVLHLTGEAHLRTVRARLPEPSGAPYVVVPYLDRMEAAYAAADLVLCRAGAMTCAELAAVGLPAVYVPLPHGNGEQRLNAAPVVAAGGGLLVEDAELDANWIGSQLIPLLADRCRCSAMGRVAAAHGRRDADVALARIVLAAAAERRR